VVKKADGTVSWKVVLRHCELKDFDRFEIKLRLLAIKYIT
jgi:hypothetical protein